MRFLGEVARRRVGTWALGATVAVGAGWACDGTLIRIRVEESASTVIAEGTLFEGILGDFGFGEFTALDVTASEELANQGVEPGDIQDVRLVQFDLRATDPDGADLSFLESIEVTVSAAGLDEVVIASGSDFPPGSDFVALEIQDVDLTEYVVSESMDVSTNARGSRPDADTTVVAEFALSVGVTSQGACRAIRGDVPGS